MAIDAALQRLIDVDRIDREIIRINNEVAALPKRIAQIEAQHAAAKAKLDASLARVKAIESDRRKAELDISAAQDKIAKLRSQSASVKTNEQYKALMHEIAFAEQEISNLETKILEGMDAADSLAPQIKLAQAEYDAEAERIEDEKRNASHLTELDKQELAKFQQQRAELRAAIDERWLMHYDRVAKNRGYGVALAKDQRCMACQVAIRPQTWNQILNGNEILTCDSCQRILWTKDEVPKTEESLKKAGAKIASDLADA
jgi:predicted  nucleic acid-binding Zn-ribbon protein